MSEKRLSQNQLEILKQIVESEEQKSSQEATSNQSVENFDSYEAFGRAVIEQVLSEGIKDVESFSDSSSEIALDAQITLIPASSEDQESLFSFIKTTVPQPLDDIWISGERPNRRLLEEGICIIVQGKKHCIGPLGKENES